MPKKPGAELVYASAQAFVENCLLRDSSILWPAETVWTIASLRSIKRNFVDAPILGGSFREKIERQFGPLPTPCWQILADALYLYCLPSTFMAADTKFSLVADLVGSHVPSMPPREDRVWRVFDQGLVRTG